MNTEDEAYWRETLRWIEISGNALVEQGQRTESLRKLDDKRIQSIPTAYLIELQSAHEPQSAQYLLAAYELQRRLTKSQIHAAYWTCGIGALIGVITAVLVAFLLGN